NELLNLATFEIIDSSHAMTYEINGRVITFTFSDIYLPDSTTNEQGSHGFVKFKLMPKEITEENTMVSNIAYIYFDFNPAVVTNTAPSIYVSELPIDKEETNIKFLDDIALIYPNPTSD